MSSVVEGVVRDLGKPYANGTPRLEIHIPMGSTGALPIQIGERITVQLTVGGAEYAAGLRATSANQYAWVCPDLSSSSGEATELGRVLSAAGFAANDSVRLLINGMSLDVLKV